MCGIIGFRTEETTITNLKVLHKLLMESKIRGLHAFGVASVTGANPIYTTKWSHAQAVVLPAAGMKNIKLIYHNRYDTSGDWNKMDNNQPITNPSKSASVAVNGVITMEPKSEWERLFGVKCLTENDAEIFLVYLEKGLNEAKEFVRNMSGSFAGVFILDGELYALRNEKRPLWHFQYDNAHYVVSTRDIAERALGHVAINPVPEYEVLVV